MIIVLLRGLGACKRLSLKRMDAICGSRRTQRDAEERNEAFLIFRRVPLFSLFSRLNGSRHAGTQPQAGGTHREHPQPERAPQPTELVRTATSGISASCYPSPFLFPTKPGGAHFSERTSTMIVSAHGAAIPLREPVIASQKLKLKNLTTKEEIGCVVIDVNSGHTDIPEVGVGFVEPGPSFWHVSFPPGRLESAKSGSQAVCLVDRPAETDEDKEITRLPVRNLRRALGVAPASALASNPCVKAQKTLLSSLGVSG